MSAIIEDLAAVGELEPRKPRKTRRVRHVVHQTLLRVWHKHFVAAVKHPHEYIVAAILTVVFLVIGQADHATITGTWLFAIVESVVNGGEG